MTKLHTRPTRGKRRTYRGPRDVLDDRLDDLEIATAELRRLVREGNPPPRFWTSTRWDVEQVTRYLARLADRLQDADRTR